MHPVLGHIGGYVVYSYGVAVALAVLAGGIALVRTARGRGELEAPARRCLVWLVLAGVAGARLAPHGAGVGVVVATLGCALASRVSPLRLGDLVAGPALVALAVERVGAFLAVGGARALEVAGAALLAAGGCALLARRRWRSAWRRPRPGFTEPGAGARS